METEEQEVEVILSDPQMAVMEARSQLILELAGQGAGKTQIIGYSTGWLVLNFPEAKGFVGANTYLQLTQSTLNKMFSVWEKVYGFTEYDPKTNPNGDFVVDKVPPRGFKRFEKLKDYYNTISFRSGALIYVGSLDNYKAHDGKEFAWAHLDETKDTKKEALTLVILGRLRQIGLFADAQGNVEWGYLSVEQVASRGLHAWNPCYIHTSPSEGQVDWLVELFQLDAKEKQIRDQIQEIDNYFYWEYENRTVVIYSTYWNQANLPPTYIPTRISTMTETEVMKFIYGYPFSKTGAEFFPYFERRQQVDRVELDETNPIIWLTFDFNYMPYMTLLCAQIKYVTMYLDEIGERHEDWQQGRTADEVMEIRFYREYCLRNPENSTEAVCKRFIDDHQHIPGLNLFYTGDASGNKHVEGLPTFTNYKEIQDTLYEYLHNTSKQVDGNNVGVMHRRDFLNKIFAGKLPIIVLFDESMKETIKDFEYLKIGKEGKHKEMYTDPQTGASYQKIGHTSDAAEYLICKVARDLMRLK